LVEQRIENPRVGGSIPPQATKRFKDLAPQALGPFSLGVAATQPRKASSLLEADFICNALG
jgi:hypothetical protein